MKTFLALIALLAVMLGAGGSAHADTRLADTVQAHGLWANTSSYTPPIYEMYAGSYACTTDVKTAYPPLAARFVGSPLPCYFQPSVGTDGEAVVLDYAHDKTYEFWAMSWDAQQGWHAAWGGADDNANFVQTPGGRQWAKPDGPSYGTQASGLAFVPGIITVADLAHGSIDHAVHFLVPRSCTTWRYPATRTDGGAAPTGTEDCYELGTTWKLPQDFVIPSTWPYVIRLIAQAAKDHGIVATDSTNNSAGFRFENWNRPWSWWGNGSEAVNPYDDPNGRNYFGCPASGWSWSCSIDNNNLGWYLLQRDPNAKSFWEALEVTN